MLLRNANERSSESLRPNPIDGWPDSERINFEQILECYERGEDSMRSATSSDGTTLHLPGLKYRPEGASELPVPLPNYPRESPVREHGLPNGSNARSPRLIPTHPSTELQKLPLVFGVEVSSTCERVFEQEKQAVSYLISKLETTELANQSYIVPWDRRTHDLVPANSIENLEHSFGSDPSTILKHSPSRNLLEQSKIWFLMTDGVIEEERTNALTNDITETGLHGTPSVVIVFGNRSRPPSQSKFTIGMSTCAASPHCVVLFHDAWSGELFVVQAKGCFATLLPKGSYFKWFSGTKWSDFPRTSYDKLLRVRVPEPIQLSKDQIGLPYGGIFDMKFIYNDSMSDEDKSRLVSNNSALDTVIAVAKTRGEGFLVKLWIESLRRTTRRDGTMERDDVGFRGRLAMTRLWMAAEDELKAQNTRHKDVWSCLTSTTSPRWSRCMQMHLPSYLDFSRESVRLQNKKNWCNFEAKIEMEQAASRRVTKSLQEVQAAIGVLDNPLPDGRSLVPADTFWYPTSGIKAEGNNEKPSTSVKVSNLDKEDVGKALFLPGFRGSRKLKRSEGSQAYATCPICQEPNAIQVLLLQSSLEVNKTSGLPLPDQRLEVKYPLALGDCPELRVIHPITCCDGCAFLLLDVEKTYTHPRSIAAALPLVSLQEKQNRRLWRSKLSEIYKHRFHERTVLTIFLATICTEIESAPSLTQSKCLRWCRDELSKLPGIPIPKIARPKLVTSLPTGADDMVPPQQVAFFACLGNRFYLRAVLAQPVEGFAVLVHLTASMHVVKPESLQNLVWKRLLCHFIEQHLRLRTNFGVEYANRVLNDVTHLSSSSDQGHYDKFAIALPERRTSISLTSLVNTYLIPPNSNTISQLLRTPLFGDIYSTTIYNAAIAVFLHMLANIPYYSNEIMDVLEELQGVANKLRHVGKDMRSVFEDAISVDEPGAAYIITHSESWLKYIISRG